MDNKSWAALIGFGVLAGCGGYSPQVQGPHQGGAPFEGGCPVVTLSGGSESGVSCGVPGDALRKAHACAVKNTADHRKSSIESTLKAEGLRELTTAEFAKHGITRTSDYRSPIDPKRSIPAGVSNAAPTSLLAVTADGKLAIVSFAPRVTVRSYKTCECPEMFGTPPPMPAATFYVLPAGTTVADVSRRVVVRHDVLVINTRGVRRRCQPVP